MNVRTALLALVLAGTLGSCASTPREDAAVPAETRDARSSITGRAVDASGAGISGIVVEARPDGSRERVSATTDDDGRFELALAVVVPHRLRTLDGRGHLAWGGTDGLRVEPGSTGVVAVLDRMRVVTFAVRDSKTREPVEEFSIRVLQNVANGWSSGGEPDWRSSPTGGIVQLPVGFAAATVEVRALDPARYSHPGSRLFLPFRGPLSLDPGSSDRMTIDVERGAVIRLSLDPDGALTAAIEARGLDGTLHRAVPPLRSPNPSAREFRFEPLPKGEYSITIRHPHYATRTLEPVFVTADADVDLGRIQLELMAIARVRVVLPEGASPRGVRMRVDIDREVVIVVASGHVSVYGLAPGRHHLTLPAQPPLVPVERSMSFEIEEGRVIDVLFDVRDD